MLSGAMFDEASRRQKIMQFSLDRMQRRLELVTPQLCLPAYSVTSFTVVARTAAAW